MPLKIDTSPVEKVFHDAANDMERGFKQPWSEVKKTVQQFERKQFMTSGQGAWAPVKAATLRGRKINTANQPLIDSGELMQSLTETGTAHSILEETNDSLTIGTDRVDAKRHQFGSADKKEPARPFLYISDDEEADILRLFEHDMDERLSRVTKR